MNQTLSYWVARLAPLVGKNESPVFVCANRVGVENDIKFTGECLFMIFPHGQLWNEALCFVCVQGALA